jgi:hypothetical protein
MKQKTHPFCRLRQQRDTKFQAVAGELRATESVNHDKGLTKPLFLTAGHEVNPWLPCSRKGFLQIFRMYGCMLSIFETGKFA